MCTCVCRLPTHRRGTAARAGDTRVVVTAAAAPLLIFRFGVLSRSVVVVDKESEFFPSAGRYNFSRGGFSLSGPSAATLCRDTARRRRRHRHCRGPRSTTTTTAMRYDTIRDDDGSTRNIFTEPELMAGKGANAYGYVPTHTRAAHGHGVNKQIHERRAVEMTRKSIPRGRRRQRRRRRRR